MLLRKYIIIKENILVLETMKVFGIVFAPKTEINLCFYIQVSKRQTEKCFCKKITISFLFFFAHRFYYEVGEKNC